MRPGGYILGVKCCYTTIKLGHYPQPASLPAASDPCHTWAMAKRPRRPRDFSQLARLIVDIATGEAQDPPQAPETPATEARRRGGLKGGRARAKKLSSRKRREIARKAAKVRWRR